MTDTPADDPLRSALDRPTKRPRKQKAANDAKPPKPAKEPKEIRWVETDAPRLPEDCPVLCLGRDARRYAFIDSNGQFLQVKVNELASDGVADLFAHPEAFAWLWKSFPRFGKDGHQNNWDKERAKIAIMQACAASGPFNFEERVRGEGCWRDDDGALHWHLGDTTLVQTPDGVTAYEKSPLVNGFVYPRGHKQPRPAPSRDDGTAIATLYKLLRRWEWSRGELDARLLLGWIGCALLGGALRWRPAGWVRGPSGSGKSTLQLLLRYVLGGEGSIVQASDASAAGIWTSLRSRSIPVMVDEMEAKQGDTRHTDNVIALARQAASGGRILRSSSNSESREFIAHAAFLFSSINVPPLEPQDLSRIGQLRLMPAPKGVEAIVFQADDMAAIGKQIRRALVDCWQVWPRIYSAYRDYMMGPLEFQPRTADTWGSLLAMSDLLLNADSYLAEGGADAEQVATWCKLIAPDIRSLLREAGHEFERALSHLLSTQMDPYQRGQRWTVETLVALAAGRSIPDDVKSQVPTDMNSDRANAGLIQNGLKVAYGEHPTSKQGGIYLAIAKRHRGVDRIFEQTKWQRGVYAQPLETAPGAFNSRLRFAAGKREPVVMVPLSVVLGDPTTPLEDAIDGTKSAGEV